MFARYVDTNMFHKAECNLNHEELTVIVHALENYTSKDNILSEKLLEEFKEILSLFKKDDTF